MKRKLEFPIYLLEDIPKNVHLNLLDSLDTFKHKKILTNEEFYNEYQLHQGNDTYSSNISRRFNNELVEVLFDGIELVHMKADSRERLFELEEKAKELDKLKTSLANIKTVIGDIK